jgi:hypothetical protein
MISELDDLAGNYRNAIERISNPCAEGPIPTGGTNDFKDLANTLSPFLV